MKENLRNYSELFHPLEKTTSGRKSAEKIVWNEDLRLSFLKVQEAVKNPDYLALAKPNEKLYIYPDYQTNPSLEELLCTLREKVNG